MATNPRKVSKPGKTKNVRVFLVARRNVSTGAVTFAYGGEWELSKLAAKRACIAAYKRECART